MTEPKAAMFTEAAVLRQLQKLKGEMGKCYQPDRPRSLVQLDIQLRSTKTKLTITGARLGAVLNGAPLADAERACLEGVFGAPAELTPEPPEALFLENFEGAFDIKMPIRGAEAPSLGASPAVP